MGYLTDEEISISPQHKRPRITRESITRIRLDEAIETLPVPIVNEKSEDELQQLKALTLKLENAYNNLQTRNQTLTVEYKAKSSEYNDIIDQLASEKKDAEARAIYHHKQAQDAMNSLALIKADHSNVTERLRLKLDELESQNSRLSSDIISEQSSRERASLELQTKQSEWQSRIHHLEDSVKVLQKQVESQQESIAQGLEREAELTRKWTESDTQLKELNNAKFDTEAIVAFDRQIKLQDDTRKVEIENYKLKGELKHYKELYHNVEMLREEKYSLESRVREMDKLIADNLRLDMENARFRLEKAEWAGYLEKADGLDFETPQGLVYNLTKERYESRLATAQVTALRTELGNRDKLVSSLETHVDELKKLNQDKDRTHRSDVFAMELLEKDKSLLKKHVEMLENQYKLYDIEEENYMEGNYDIQKTQRIRQLEGLLKEFEDRLSIQAQDLIKSQVDANYLSTVSAPPPGPYSELASGQSITEFMSKLSKDQQSWIENEKTLRCEINSQANTIKITKDQLQLLQELIDRHEMQPKPSAQQSKSSEEVPDGVRILEYKNNPASTQNGIRKQQLEDLRKENSVLLKRLLQYQNSTGGTQSMDLSGGDNERFTSGEEDNDTMTIPKLTLSNLETRIQTLEKTVAQKDKRITRLMEVFTKKTQDIKDQMASIFGYRIVRHDRRVIELESTFVNGKDLYFEITLLKNDRTGLRVLGRQKNEYLRTLQDVYHLYVKVQKFIPGFLSAATLDLYDRQKIEMDEQYDDHEHNYLERNPVTDFQGHELVQPEPIDQEDELDTDFVAEADDSGDNDYMECIPGNAEGYDGDRLQYFEGQDEEDTEDYNPNTENKEIWHQEVTGESTYEGYDDVAMTSGFNGDNETVGEDGDGINDRINYGDDGTDGTDHGSASSIDEYDEEDESEGEDDNNDTHTTSAWYAQPQFSQQGQEDDPISLDDDDD